MRDSSRMGEPRANVSGQLKPNFTGPIVLLGRLPCLSWIPSSRIFLNDTRHWILKVSQDKQDEDNLNSKVGFKLGTCGLSHMPRVSTAIWKKVLYTLAPTSSRSRPCLDLPDTFYHFQAFFTKARKPSTVAFSFPFYSRLACGYC